MSSFPILILLVNSGQTLVCYDPKDIPNNTPFKVLKTRVK